MRWSYSFNVKLESPHFDFGADPTDPSLCVEEAVRWRWGMGDTPQETPTKSGDSGCEQQAAVDECALSPSHPATFLVAIFGPTSAFHFAQAFKLLLQLEIPISESKITGWPALVKTYAELGITIKSHRNAKGLPAGGEF